jgi:hypothetical protein
MAFTMPSDFVLRANDKIKYVAASTSVSTNAVVTLNNGVNAPVIEAEVLENTTNRRLGRVVYTPSAAQLVAVNASAQTIINNFVALCEAYAQAQITLANTPA